MSKKKFVRDCNECKEQKKASVCRECHAYWMGRLTAAEDSRASAIGKLGAYKTNFLKAQKAEKAVIADFVELQHEMSLADAEIKDKKFLLKHEKEETDALRVTMNDSITAHEITKKALINESYKKDLLEEAAEKIQEMSQAGNKLFARKLALQMIWKKTDEAIGEVSED